MLNKLQPMPADQHEPAAAALQLPRLPRLRRHLETRLYGDDIHASNLIASTMTNAFERSGIQKQNKLQSDDDVWMASPAEVGSEPRLGPGTACGRRLVHPACGGSRLTTARSV